MSNDGPSHVQIAGTIVLVALFSIGSYGVGFQDARNRERQRAIEADVGRWKIDSKTGDKEFVYGKDK